MLVLIGLKGGDEVSRGANAIPEEAELTALGVAIHDGVLPTACAFNVFSSTHPLAINLLARHGSVEAYALFADYSAHATG